jgi:hypothetical protein
MGLFVELATILLEEPPPILFRYEIISPMFAKILKHFSLATSAGRIRVRSGAPSHGR